MIREFYETIWKHTRYDFFLHLNLWYNKMRFLKFYFLINWNNKNILKNNFFFLRFFLLVFVYSFCMFIDFWHLVRTISLHYHADKIFTKNLKCVSVGQQFICKVMCWMGIFQSGFSVSGLKLGYCRFLINCEELFSM